MDINDTRPIGQRSYKVVSVRKWRGSDMEQVVEYHETIEEAIDFINKQKQPVDGEFEWLVGEYA